MSDNDNDKDKDKEEGNGEEPKNRSKPVGYKLPPEHTRFKPGQSGNPKGRRNGSKNIKTLLDEHLRRRVPATVDGKRQRISKAEALVVQTVNKAINDPKIGLAFMQYVMRSEGSGEQAGAGVAPLPGGPEQDRIIEEFLRAVRASSEPEAGTPDADGDGDGENGGREDDA